MSVEEPYTFMELDVEEREIKKHHFTYVPGDSDDDEETSKNPKKMRAAARDRMAHERAIRFFGVLPANSTQALALFDLIYPKLERRNVCPDTLEIVMQRKGGSQSHVKISLIEYIALLVDEKHLLPRASKLILKFHAFVKKIVELPTAFVINSKFQ